MGGHAKGKKSLSPFACVCLAPCSRLIRDGLVFVEKMEIQPACDGHYVQKC